MKRKVYGFLLLLVVIAGCDARTGGVRIQFQASAIAKLSNGQPVGAFENRLGWKITLEKASMLLGPVYLYEGKPRLASWWKGLQLWGVAHADPGHITVDNRKILGEIRDQYVLDLLKSEATSLGQFTGVEGQLQAMELQLLPSGAANVAAGDVTQVNGATFYGLGKAEKDGKTVAFELKLTVPDSGTMRVVEGIAADIQLLSSTVSSGQLEIQVLVDRLFDSVDFAEVLNAAPDANLALLDERFGSMLQGVRSRYSYNVVWK
ncbi:MAG: hypothetical protein H6728_16450 [Myxococcales bacterium]|nr:hypothetical protein [Myxococcales bacterium]